MRIAIFVLAFLLLAGLPHLADGQSDQNRPYQAGKIANEEMDRLVKQLGDALFAKRLEARKQLEKIGEPAIDILKKAAAGADDLEIRIAAKAIVEAFDLKQSGFVSVFRGHNERVNGVAIGADGKYAVSGSWDGVVRYWDLQKKVLIREMKGQGAGVNGVALSPDGKYALSSGRDGTASLWDLATGQTLRIFTGHRSSVWDIAFSPDGKKALSGSSDGTTRLWDVDSGKELLALETLIKGYAWTVAFTPDGKRAVSGGGDAFMRGKDTQAVLRLWDLTNGMEVRRFIGHTKDVRRVAVSPDGKRLLSASFDGTMRLWDLETGKELKRFDGPGHFVEGVSFTPDGQRAICSYGPSVLEAVYDEDPRCNLRLWDLTSGKELRQFKGHDGPVLSLAISGDGRFLISGSADRSIRIWQLIK